MKLALITLSAVIGIVLVCVCGVMSSYNGAVSLEESVKTSQSDIDVQMSNRFNKITELAECVRKYDEHEYSTIVDTISVRGKNMTSGDVKECLATFSRVEERYPELKSQKNYEILMTEISIAENHLSQTKKGFNEFVRDYNRYVRKFPTSIFLNWTGYSVQKFEYYVADESVKSDKPMKIF